MQSTPPSTTDQTRLTVLLATHNGATFLDEQLASIAALIWDDIDVRAADDGSTDGTMNILEDWKAKWTKGRFEIEAGSDRGFAENFRQLIIGTPSDVAYVAFSDQDDIWLPEKLQSAVAAIGKESGPALFCSRTVLADANGHRIGFSPDFRRPPSFRNALVQSIAGGNTMVLNSAAFELVRVGASRTGFVSHDWFTYQLVSGAGGLVHYAHDPLVIYRQHETNAVGSSVGWKARLRRVPMLLRGRFQEWTSLNIAAMEACADLLTDEANRTVAALACTRHQRLLARLRGLVAAKLYRQTVFGQLSLYVACVLGKL